MTDNALFRFVADNTYHKVVCGRVNTFVVYSYTPLLEMCRASGKEVLELKTEQVDYTLVQASKSAVEIVPNKSFYYLQTNMSDGPMEMSKVITVAN